MNENDQNNPQSTPVTNNEDIISSLKPEPPKVSDENLADIAARKKKEIAKKQKVFKRIMLVVKLIVIANILVIAGVNIWKWQQKHSGSPFTVQNPTTAPPANNVIVDDTNPITWKIFNSDAIKVFIRHPQSAQTFEKQTPALKAEAVYAPKNEGEVDETNLKEGYIFRVTPLDVGLRGIKDITSIKLQSFKARCPENASFSNPKEQLIDTIDALTFEITNCNVDYVISYIPRFGIYYEIQQIFKGDFGIRQRYKAITGDMLKAFRFYPEETRPVGPFKTFINEKIGFLIAHPNLDETCCFAPEPPDTDIRMRLERVVNLGDRNTFRDAENFDGLTIFAKRAAGSLDLEAFIQTQRNYLIEDYKVVVGKAPDTQDIQIKVGDYPATMLRGYSWRGNDLIYFTAEGKMFIISVKNLTGERFERTLNEILRSFETF